jgi:hypothetical protein
LILALDLVVQDDPFDARTALPKALGPAKIRAVDLRVVLHLARLLEVRVELLASTAVTAPMRLQLVLAAFGQDHRDVLAAVHRNRSNEALLTKMSKVAGM